MSFTFKFRDTGEIDRMKRALPGIARKTVNRATVAAALVAKDAMLRNYNVAAAAIDKAIKISPANEESTTPVAKIIARGGRLPATMFLPQQTDKGTSIEIRRGVRREIRGAFLATTSRGYGRRGGQSKKVLNRIMRNFRHSLLPRAKDPEMWIQRGLTTGRKYSASVANYQNMRTLVGALGLTRASVFVRKGKSRLPIKEVGGTSVANLFSSGVVTREIKTFLKAGIPKIFKDEIDQWLARRR